MKKLLFTLLSLFSSQIFSETISPFAGQSISPTYCIMSYQTKIPSCTLNITADEGTKITALFFKHIEKSSYNETNNPFSDNFIQDPDFTISPLIASWKEQGTKNIRVVYKKTINPSIQGQEIYGRVLLKLEKNGQQTNHNIPVFFNTNDNQTPVIDLLKLINENGKNYLEIHNSGNGVFPFSMVSFDDKELTTYDLKKDFLPLNGVVIPHSTAKILLTDSLIVQNLTIKKNIVFFNKKTFSLIKLKL